MCTNAVQIPRANAEYRDARPLVMLYIAAQQNGTEHDRLQIQQVACFTYYISIPVTMSEFY